MGYKLLILDIDGTLRPLSRAEIPAENVEALQALQASGVKIAIATGRSRGAVSPQILNGLEADYWICCAGAQVLNHCGNVLWERRMTPQVLDCIISFFREWDYPFFLCREDGNHLFSGREKYLSLKSDLKPAEEFPYSPDIAQAYSNLPHACFAWMSQDGEAAFHARYPDAPVSFYFYRNTFCDIMQEGVTKATGLDQLLLQTGIDLSETVSVGDGENDIPLLQHTAISYAVADGKPPAVQAAKRICPPAESFGVAAVCHELWPEAFCQEAGISPPDIR